MIELLFKIFSDNTLILGVISALISILALFFGIRSNREKFFKVKHLIESKYVNYQFQSIYKEFNELQENKELVKKLLPDLLSDNPEIKMKAIKILLNIRSDEAIDGLLEYLVKENNRDIKYLVLRMLSNEIELLKK